MENELKDEKQLADASCTDKSLNSIHDSDRKDADEQSGEVKSQDTTEENVKLHHEKEGEELDSQSGSLRSEHMKDKEQLLEETLADVNLHHEEDGEGLNTHVHQAGGLESESVKAKEQTLEEVLAEEKEVDPVFDGTEDGPEFEETQRSDSEAQAFAWPEKAVALKNFVKEKGTVAVSTLLRRLSGRKDEDGPNFTHDEEKHDDSVVDNEEADSGIESKLKEALQKAGELASRIPLNYIKMGRDANIEHKPDDAEDGAMDNKGEVPIMRGRIIVYTKLGCQDCKEVRLFLHWKRLRYVEINIDIYPSRKLELEKNTGSSAVPRVYFNDFLVGGLTELKALDESGKLGEKVNYVIDDEPSPEAPLPPLPGEDDLSGSGKIDEFATLARKMRETIVVKDRFSKMRRFNNCFLGSEAVDFLSDDQYLEREEAVEFGKKLVSQHFFRHVMDENIFEDSNHLYRFLEHDPIVMTQCYNIPRGTIDVKPKPIVEIASRLRLLSFAIFEAYVSQDGRHIDYGSIYGSEEFQRYKRITEELHRVDLDKVSREEKLAFFINLHNMMAIHAILTWGYPVGALDRRKFLGDFKYVIGGCTYSLSAIQNGILRGNQRPPYNLTKPFGPRDKRSKVALQYTEPLVHFALVWGTRSGPALRCYSPGDIDAELMEAARDFLRNGGLAVDAETKVVSVSKILRWYSVDFGKNETEMLKHAANYLEPEKAEQLLELLATNQLKVTYQPYNWGLNS